MSESHAFCLSAAVVRFGLVWFCMCSLGNGGLPVVFECISTVKALASEVRLFAETGSGVSFYACECVLLSRKRRLGLRTVQFA